MPLENMALPEARVAPPPPPPPVAAMTLPPIPAPVIPPVTVPPIEMPRLDAHLGFAGVKLPVNIVEPPALHPIDQIMALVGEPMNAATRRRLEHSTVALVEDLHRNGVLTNQITTNAGTVGYAQTVTYTVGPSQALTWNITYRFANCHSTTCTVNIVDNNAVWGQWNQTYTVTNTSGLTTGYSNIGCDISTTGDWNITITNGVNQAAWTAWNNRYDTIQQAAPADIQRYSRRKLSEAELVAELEREKKLRLEAEQRALKLKLAQERAEKLLRSCLTPQQIEDLDKKNCIYVDVKARDGKMERYRIDRGTHGNVKQLDAKGSIIRSFCIQPEGVPVADSMLTQKLWLEASEETRAKFWETANITALDRSKEIPYTIPRQQRRQYAQQHGLLH